MKKDASAKIYSFGDDVLVCEADGAKYWLMREEDGWWLKNNNKDDGPVLLLGQDPDNEDYESPEEAVARIRHECGLPPEELTVRRGDESDEGDKVRAPSPPALIDGSGDADGVADETGETETAWMIRECNERACAAEASLAEIRKATEEDKLKVRELRREMEERRKAETAKCNEMKCRWKQRMEEMMEQMREEVEQ